MMPYVTETLPHGALLVSPMSATASFAAVLAAPEGVRIIPGSSAAACGGVPVLDRERLHSLSAALAQDATSIERWARGSGSQPLDLADGWRVTRDHGVTRVVRDGVELKFDERFGRDANDHVVLLSVLRLCMDRVKDP